MKNTIYQFTSKAVLIVCCFFLTTAFSFKPQSNLYEAIRVNVEKEKDAVTVSVKASLDNNIEFFMFNVEGKLIKELNIQGTRKVSIDALEKGIYMYEFFNKDERIKSGKIVL